MAGESRQGASQRAARDEKSPANRSGGNSQNCAMGDLGSEIASCISLLGSVERPQLVDFKARDTAMMGLLKRRGIVPVSNTTSLRILCLIGRKTWYSSKLM